MEDYQKGTIAFLFLIFITLLYGQLYPPITKAPLFSTQASTTVLDLQSVRAYFNVSSGYGQIDGNTSLGGTYVPPLFIKGKIFAMYLSGTSKANVSVVLMDPYNDRNTTLFTFYNGSSLLLTGSNYTRELAITYYGALRFNVTGGGPVERNNGTLIFVDVLYQGVS